MSWTVWLWGHQALKSAAAGGPFLQGCPALGSATSSPLGGGVDRGAQALPLELPETGGLVLRGRGRGWLPEGRGCRVDFQTFSEGFGWCSPELFSMNSFLFFGGREGVLFF